VSVQLSHDYEHLENELKSLAAGSCHVTVGLMLSQQFPPRPATHCPLSTQSWTLTGLFLPTPHFTENLNFDIVTVVTPVTHKSCLISFDKKKKRNKIREQKMPRTFGRNMKMKKITHLPILSSLFTSDCSRG